MNCGANVNAWAKRHKEQKTKLGSCVTVVERRGIFSRVAWQKEGNAISVRDAVILQSVAKALNNRSSPENGKESHLKRASHRRRSVDKSRESIFRGS